MTRETFIATIHTVDPSFGRDVDAATPIGTAKTDGTAADTAVGTIQTDQATAFTNYGTFAAALLAITGDTYNGTTHQFTFGGATGLTHAQWATVGALLNTALTAFNTTKTDADAAKTATALVVTDLAAVPAVNADVVISFNTSNVVSFRKLAEAVRGLLTLIGGQGILS